MCSLFFDTLFPTQAWLDSDDGRRRYFPNAGDVPRIAPNSRPIDHLLHALPLWAGVAAAIASSMKSLISTMQQADNWSDSVHLDADLATELLMRAMLKLPLVGRSALQASVSLEAAVHCYSLKFMLEDFLLFVACASCRHKRRTTGEVLSSVPVRCNCISCKLIWRLRLRYMFIGPAPRALLQACTHQPLEQTLPTLRVLNQKLNEILCTKLCLYTPQCLPWTWRKFLFWRRKHADGDPAQHCKLWISERKPGSFEKGRWPSRTCFTTAACAKIDEICVLLQFRAIDPPNPARGLVEHKQTVRVATAVSAVRENV